eukprot:gb/GECH01003317.1/.p1 GENE.gb/GECH01003317.1/~~gb/GECH01003317.1/.p1  ORF type:complete len:166 (+),score=54.04 gb/GECH01003317.1/:1-498(+)
MLWLLWLAMKRWAHRLLMRDRDQAWRRIRDGENDEDGGETKVVVLLNTDQVTTVQTPPEHDLKTVSLDENNETVSSDNKIGLPLSNYPESNLSVIGLIDATLLSFVVNVLLSHPFKSIIMLNRTDSEKQETQQHETTKQEEEESDEQVFQYSPSPAERMALEERF